MTVQSSAAIRPLNYSDLPQVLAIERRSFPTPWSLAMFVLELSRPSGVCLAMTEVEQVVVDGGSEGGRRARAAQQRLLGYVICSRYADDWHIMNIAVDPTARRRGLATALLEELFARAGRERAYTLEVRTSNDPAIALYKKFGFRASGIRPRYYQDTGEDALIMWRVGEKSSLSQ
jgi:[ribosomal protein S18]-alanine N-acetyltransferase